MKILKKDNKFMKMPDINMNDVKKINNMINSGWQFSNKKDYKMDKNGFVNTPNETEDVQEVVKEKKQRKSKK